VIAANDFQRQWEEVREDVHLAVETVGKSGWYVLGHEVAAFESALAALWHRKFAVGVANGSDALEIALRAAGCKPGDKVLTTPLSAFATTMAIVRIGGVPVFVDCDEYGLIDLDQCETVLQRDGAIRFFVPVHLYGNSLDLDRLARLRDRYGLRVVEDCAQSILATFGPDRRLTGTVGDAAATSFYPTKNLGAFGDGGAILTDDEEITRTARMLRDYGQSAKYEHATMGYNSRLDELHAAILRIAQLPRLMAWTKARRGTANAYAAGISHSGIRHAGSPAHSDSCWHLYPVFVSPEFKPDFMAHLRNSGVMPSEHYPKLIPDQDAMSSVVMERADGLAIACRICQSEVSLPIHPHLTQDEVNAVIDACNSWEQ
jgi:dTDP-4-amino-4,6-dideoxygalactose transaminase